MVVGCEGNEARRRWATRGPRSWRLVSARHRDGAQAPGAARTPCSPEHFRPVRRAEVAAGAQLRLSKPARPRVTSRRATQSGHALLRNSQGRREGHRRRLVLLRLRKGLYVEDADHGVGPDARPRPIFYEKPRHQRRRRAHRYRPRILGRAQEPALRGPRRHRRYQAPHDQGPLATHERLRRAY